MFSLSKESIQARNAVSVLPAMRLHYFFQQQRTEKYINNNVSVISKPDHHPHPPPGKTLRNYFGSANSPPLRHKESAKLQPVGRKIVLKPLPWGNYLNPIPHRGLQILPTTFLGPHNSGSESSSNTKFGTFSWNLMGNLTMIINFQNMLSVSRDMIIFGKRSLKNRNIILANQERCSDIQFGPRVRFGSSFLNLFWSRCTLYWVVKGANPPPPS